jgi:hypothetical protein
MLDAGFGRQRHLILELEILNIKYETNPNDQNLNDQNRKD